MTKHALQDSLTNIHNNCNLLIIPLLFKLSYGGITVIVALFVVATPNSLVIIHL